GVDRESIAPKVLEIDACFHQADIAFPNQIKELQAAVGVFLGDGNDEAQIGLDHLLLGLARLALALLHDVHDAAELADLQAGLGSEIGDLAADILDYPAPVVGENGPTFLLQAPDAAEPVGVELVRLIFVEEVLALHAIALGEAEQAPLIAEQLLVDVVESLDQALDTVGIERQRLDLGDDLVLQDLV